MATKKKQPIREDYGAPPATLEGHCFYGLELDDEQKIFRDAIWNPDNDIIFCDACAGVGKTTIALGTANLLVKFRKQPEISWRKTVLQHTIIFAIQVVVISTPAWDIEAQRHEF